jgi:anti-sigma factor RsiW
MTEPGESLLGRLLGPAEPEVSCEECFDRLDEYVEAELRGEDADAAVPGLRAHLAGCPACAEDHAALRDLVRHDAGEAVTGGGAGSAPRPRIDG